MGLRARRHHPGLDPLVEGVAVAGGTPLVIAEGGGPQVTILGVIHLKDVVKEGMRTRFEQLRAMGIRTVMITGDNPLTARYLDRSRRRRLPCRGHTRGDGPDPPRASQRPPGGHDR